jgi:hypothetical protein
MTVARPDSTRQAISRMTAAELVKARAAGIEAAMRRAAEALAQPLTPLPSARRSSSDAEVRAQYVSGAIGGTDCRPVAATAAVRKFAPRRYQCLPDRKAKRDRRRTLARDGFMPDHLRDRYTEGEAAVHRIIAGEIMRKGYCDLFIDEMAKRAGVRRTTVQNALRQGIACGHISRKPQRISATKNRPNIIRIISRDWLEWLKRGRVLFTRIVGNGVGLKTPTSSKFSSTTKSQVYPPKAFQGERQHGIRAESG